MNTDTTTPSTGSARERMAECDTVLAVIGERLAEAEAELAGFTLRDPKRHTLRRRIGEMRADLEDAQAERARLAPAVQEERAADMFAARVAQHAQAMQAAEQADAIAARMDRALAEIVRVAPAYLEWAGRCAAAAGVDPHPYRLGETVPTMDHLRDVILAKLVAGGIVDRDFLPAIYEDHVACHNDLRISGLLFPGTPMRTPLELAAEASISRDVHGAFKRAIAGAAPDRQRREQEHLAELSRQRAEREAEEMAKPRTIGAPPLPIMHSPAIVR